MNKHGYNPLPRFGFNERSRNDSLLLFFMHKLHLAIVSLLLLGGLASCQKQTIDASGNTAAIYESNLADIKNYVTSKGLSGSTTSSGLYYASTQPGSSTVAPAYGEELEFNYKLYVLNGSSTSSASTTVVTDKLVDSAYATKSIFLPFFAGSLRSGLEEGFLKMHEGDQATLLLPSILAFGTTGSSDGKVPANASVRYDITLKRARTENQQINEYIATNNLIITDSTSTGLRFIKTKSNPSGDSVKTGLTLTINYVGRQFHARTVVGFDSTGTGFNEYNVAGFTEGILKLKVGEKATLIFPSSIGYGTTGLVESGSTTYKIPPNTPLRYDVEVVAAK